jgi:Na+/phosphate symporter
MFGIAAVIVFVLAYILDLANASVAAAFMPGALLFLGLAFLSLHLVGVTAGSFNRRGGPM